MKIERLLELMYNYSKNLNDKILFYDGNGNELALCDIDGDEGEIVMIFEQKSSVTEVEKWNIKS